MVYNNIHGLHLAFYYCGIPHLLVNILKYVEEGLKKKELIWISCEEHIYIDFLKFAEGNNLETKNIMFSSVKPFIKAHKNGGLNALKEKQKEAIDRAIKKGYAGIRWIGQPSYAIAETSKKDFLSWEQDLTHGLKGEKMSLVCIYDFYDFMNEKKIIDEEVIQDSKITHTHTLCGFNIVKIEELYG